MHACRTTVQVLPSLVQWTAMYGEFVPFDSAGFCPIDPLHTARGVCAV